MKPRIVNGLILPALWVLFLALYVATKIDFFMRYDPLRVGHYLQAHSAYWIAMAVTVFLIWIVSRRSQQDRH